MKYREIVDGIFLDRPNRFIAHVNVNGTVETVHVKNTGRCRELLLPGAAVRLEVPDNPKRKTKYAHTLHFVMAPMVAQGTDHRKVGQFRHRVNSFLRKRLLHVHPGFP